MAAEFSTRMKRKTREDVRLFAYLLKRLSTAKVTIVIFFEVNHSCDSTRIKLFKISGKTIVLSENIPQVKKDSAQSIIHMHL